MRVILPYAVLFIATAPTLCVVTVQVVRRLNARPAYSGVKATARAEASR